MNSSLTRRSRNQAIRIDPIRFFRGRSPRNGSALIIVLGLLAVLMLMAMAFIVAMRTERGGSSNQRHAITARKMLDTALVRAMADLDAELGPEPAPAWMVYASTNRMAGQSHLSAGVLSHEAALHLPPDQLVAAQRAKPGWLPITGGIEDETDEDAILGRYAYVILNDTGYLDASLVGGSSTHTTGVSLTEVQLWDKTEDKGLPCFSGSSKVDTFVSSRAATHGRYESGDEFRRLTSGTITRNLDLSKPVAQLVFSTNYFTLTSDAAECSTPMEPGTSDENNNPYGKRKAKVKVSKGRLTGDLATFAQETKAALEQVFAGAMAGWQKGADMGTAQNAKAPCTAAENVAPNIPYINQTAVAFSALCDYLDEDLLSGRNASGTEYDPLPGLDWSDRPCTEPTPLFDSFVFWQPGGETYTRNAVNQTPGDPTTPVVSYQHTFPLMMRAQTVFLNRIVPESLQGKSFQVTFEIKTADVMDADINGDAVYEGRATTLANLRTAVAGWLEAAKGPHSYTHDPDVNSRAANKDISIPLQFESPATESPDLPEIWINLTIEGSVKLGGQDVQLFPGKSFRTDIPLPVGLYLDANVLKNSTDDSLRVGWAYVADPHFAYESALRSLVWMTRDRARLIKSASASFVPDILPWITDIETMDPGKHSTPVMHVNPYTLYLLKEATPRAFCGQGDLSGLAQPEWPDILYSGRRGQDFVEEAAELSMIRNDDMQSIGELGNLIVAPHRTLALFDGVLPIYDNIVIPRHTVLDWFTLDSSNWHRVNLNPPFVLERRTSGPSATLVSDQSLNYGPLTSVFTGLALNDFGNTDVNKKLLPWSYAQVISRAFVDHVLQWTGTPANPNNHINLANNLNGLAYDLSVLGRTPPGGGSPQAADPSGTLDRILTGLYSSNPDKGPQCDFEREALIRNSVGLLTTRQQVFTLVLKADAFTSKFGFDDAGHGTTLSSAQAIVQVWRDPEPVRDAAGKVRLVDREGGIVWGNGTRIEDKYGNEISKPSTPLRATHNWHVRYLHQF